MNLRCSVAGNRRGGGLHPGSGFGRRLSLLPGKLAKYRAVAE